MNNKYITKRLEEFEKDFCHEIILDQTVRTVLQGLRLFIAESIHQAVAEEKDRAREILIDGKRYKLMEEEGQNERQ